MKNLKYLLPLLLMTVLLSGCSHLLESRYISVKPHTETANAEEDENILTAENYLSLKNAILSLVENGVESRVKVEIGTEHADKNSLRVLLGNDEKVQVRTKIAKSLHAPVREGTPVGQRDYMVDGIVIDSDPVVTAGNVELWDFEYAEKIVMGKFWM